MKFIFNTIYTLLIIAVVAVALLLLGTLLPFPGRIQVKIVKSGSMEPAIQTGGIVVIKPESSYTTGDIITFGPDTKTQIPTTHRIVGETGSGSSKVFTTKGDANDTADQGTTPQSSVDGKVLFTLPYMGYVLDFGRKPLGFFLLVGIPALSIIIDEVWKIIKEIKALRGKKRDKKPPTDDSKDTKDPTKGGKTKIVIGSLCLLLSIGSLSKIGSTVSYFKDSESSFENSLMAGTAHFNLISDSDDSNDNEEETIEENSIGSKVFALRIEEGENSFPLLYEAKGSLALGSPLGCEEVKLDAWVGAQHWVGFLKDFSVPLESKADELKFIAEIPIESSLSPEDTCTGIIGVIGTAEGNVEGEKNVFHDEKSYSFALHNYPALAEPQFFSAPLTVEASTTSTVPETESEDLPSEENEELVESVEETMPEEMSQNNQDNEVPAEAEVEIPIEETEEASEDVEVTS